MPYNLHYTGSFNARLKKIISKFPRSENRVKKEIAGLADDPNQGDPYPSFGAYSVRKMRIGLPEYNIGKSHGLRLIYLVVNDKIIPLHVYPKSQFRSESDVLKETKAALKEVLIDLSSPD